MTDEEEERVDQPEESLIRARHAPLRTVYALLQSAQTAIQKEEFLPGA